MKEHYLSKILALIISTMLSGIVGYTQEEPMEMLFKVCETTMIEVAELNINSGNISTDVEREEAPLKGYK